MSVIRDASALQELRAEQLKRSNDRYRLVAALARCFPSGTQRTAIPGWRQDSHGCVYIDLPTGQVSWHYHDSQAHWFKSLPYYAGEWDGHSNDEKNARVERFFGIDALK